MSFLKNIKFSLVYLVLFVLYTISVMLLFSDKGDVFWLSYAFTILAFIIQFILIFSLASKNKSSHFNSFALLITSNFYLFIQIIASILLMFNILSLEWTIVIQSVILGIFAIICLILSQAKDYIESAEEDTKNRTSFLKKMKKELEILSNKVDDDLKDNFDDLFKVVNNANPRSIEEVSSLEDEIIATFDELKEELNQNNNENILKNINKLKDMFSQREVLVKQ